MEEQLSYDSALRIERRLDDIGLCIGESLSAAHYGQLYKLKRSLGPRLPGAIDSQQLRVDTIPNKPVGRYVPRERYLIIWGTGKKGPTVSSEKRRVVNGNKEYLGPLREGDFLYLLDIFRSLVNERNSKLLIR